MNNIPGWSLVRGLAPLLLVVLVAGTASAFEVLRVSNDPCDNASRNLSWPSAAARVEVDIDSPEGFGNLASEAYARWNDRVQRFRFRSGSGTACDLSDGVVTITFSTKDCSGGTLDGVLALTTSRWRSSGELLDAAVVVNSNSVARTDEGVFLQVVMHELGHVLGLDHSDACGDSGEGTLMRSVLILSQARLDGPQFDDVAGANFIYSSSDSGDNGDDDPELANSCAVVPPSRRQSGLPLLLVLLLIGLGRFLHRRRGGSR
jgi:hypothetical protein